MKIKDYKCKCGCDDFFFAHESLHKGIYCSYCGKWLKWADKDEQNLSMKQKPILDNIKDEIEGYKSTIDNAISEDELKIEGMKEAYTDCLKIIDKYKGETKQAKNPDRMEEGE